MGSVVAFRTKENESVSRRSPMGNTLIDLSLLQELLIECATDDIDYEDFVKETGLTIATIELMKDESVMMEWIENHPAVDDPNVWEYYMHFLFERFGDTFDPYGIMQNPFVSYKHLDK